MTRFIVVAVAIVLGGWIGWDVVDTELPYEYIRGEIIPNPARQGAQVLLPWEIKVNRLCSGNVLRVLYNADTGDMVAAYDRTPSSISVKMGETRLVKSFQLPFRGMPKHIRYTANVCFQCNLLQQIRPLCVDTPELFFEVEPDDLLP